MKKYAITFFLITIHIFVFAQELTQIYRTTPIPEKALDVNGSIFIMFTRELNQNSINENVTLTDIDDNPIPSTIEYHTQYQFLKPKIVIKPNNDLEYGAFYKVTLKNLVDEYGKFVDLDGNGLAGGERALFFNAEISDEFYNNVYSTVDDMATKKLMELQYYPDIYDPWKFAEKFTDEFISQSKLIKEGQLKIGILNIMDFQNGSFKNLVIQDNVYIDGEKFQLGYINFINNRGEQNDLYIILDESGNYIENIEKLFKAHFYFQNKNVEFDAQYFEGVDWVLDKINRRETLINVLQLIRDGAAGFISPEQWAGVVKSVAVNIAINYPKLFMDSFVRNKYHFLNNIVEESLNEFSNRQAPYLTYQETALIYYMDVVFADEVEAYSMFVDELWSDETNIWSQLSNTAQDILLSWGFEQLNTVKYLPEVFDWVYTLDQIIVGMFEESIPLSNYTERLVSNESDLNEQLFYHIVDKVSRNLALLDILNNYNPQQIISTQINKNVFYYNEDIIFKIILNDEYENPITNKQVYYKIETEDGIVIQNGTCTEDSNNGGIYISDNAFAPYETGSYKIYAEIYDENGNTLEKTSSSTNFNVIFPSNSGITLSASPNPVNKYSSTLLTATFTSNDGTPLYNEPIEFETYLDGAVSGGEVNNYTDITDVNGVATVSFIPTGSSGKIYAKSLNHTNISPGAITLDVNNSGIDYIINISVKPSDIGEISSRYRIRISVDDPTGNNASDVNLQVSSSSGEIEDPNLITDGYGIASTYINVQQSGNVTFYVSAGGTSESVQSYLTVGVPEELSPIKTIPLGTTDSEFYGIDWSNDGSKLAVSVRGNPDRVDIYSVSDWTIIKTIEVDYVIGVGFSPDDQKLCVIDNGYINIFDFAQDKITKQVTEPDGNGDESKIVSWLSNDKILIGGSYNDYSEDLYIVSSSDLSVIKVVSGTSGVDNVSVSSDKNYFIAGNFSDHANLYNSNGTLVKQYGYTDAYCGVFSPNNSRLLINGDNDFIAVIDFGTKNEINQITGDWTYEFFAFDWSKTKDEYFAGATRSKLCIFKYNFTNDNADIIKNTAISFSRGDLLKWCPTMDMLAAGTSNSIFIFNPFDNTKPQLTISKPQDSYETYDSEIVVEGGVYDDYGIKDLLINCNGVEYKISSFENDLFSQQINLEEGENNITLTVTDNSGLITSNSLTVIRKQDITGPIISNVTVNKQTVEYNGTLIISAEVFDAVNEILNNSVDVTLHDENNLFSYGFKLYDNGINGDAIAGDGIFSSTLNLNDLNLTLNDFNAFFILTATDNSSNNNQTVKNDACYSFIYDKPLIQNDNIIPNDKYKNEVLSLNVQITDYSEINNATFQYWLNPENKITKNLSKQVNTNDWETKFTTNNEGAYQGVILATDKYGYTTQKPINFEVLDKSPIVNIPLEDIYTYENQPDIIVDLSNLFTDPDDNDNDIVSTVFSNTNSGLLNATIQNNLLVISLNSDSFGSSTITVKGLSNNKDVYTDVNVYVEEKACDLQISKNDLSFLPEGNTVSFNLSSSDDWWLRESFPTILNIQPKSGSAGDNTQISIKAFDNPEIDEFNGTITILNSCGNEQVISLSQAGSCNLSVSSSNIEFDNEGSTENFTLTSNDSWSITSDFPSSLDISPTSGEAGEDISISVIARENTSANSLSGSITVKNGCGNEHVINLTQTGSCNLFVSTSTIEFAEEGNTENFTLTSNDSWSIISDFPSTLDISPTSGDAGENISITMITPENTSSNLFSGTITIKNDCGNEQVISLTQSGSCNLSVSSSNIEFDKEGSTENFTLTSNDSWSITSDYPAMLEISPTSGEAGEEISISVIAPENTSANSLSGTITITSDCGNEQVVSLTQTGSCNLFVSPSSIEFEKLGSTENFTLTSNDSWSITSDYPATLEISPTSGDAGENISITVIASENTSANPLSGSITITSVCGNEQVISLAQVGSCNLLVSPSSIEFERLGSTENFTLTSNDSWSITSDYPATLDISTTSGNAGENITVSVSAPDNTSANSLSGTITIINECGNEQVISLTQDGSCNLFVSTSTIEFAEEGNTENFTLTSNNSWSITSDFPSTLDISPTSGDAGEDISVSVGVPQNTSANSLSGTIIITNECGNEQVISLSQSGSCSLIVSTNSIVFDKDGNTVNFTITSSNDWNIVPEYPATIGFSSTSGDAGENISVSVIAPENNNGISLSGTITITNECGNEQTISLSQDDITVGINTATIPSLNLYPNPFNDEVNMEFVSKSADKISIEIFDIQGRKVKIITRACEVGLNKIIWNGTDQNNNRVVSGFYFIHFENNTGRQIFKVSFIEN